MKKLIAIAIVALMALTMLVACGGSGAGSAAACAEEAVRVSKEFDIDGMMELVPDYLIEDMGTGFGLDEGCTRSEVAKAYKEFVEALKALAGDAYKAADIQDVKSEVIKELNKGDEGFDAMVEEYVAGLSDTAVSKFVKDKLASIASVKVSATVDGEPSEETMTCVKYDGKWYVGTN